MNVLNTIKEPILRELVQASAQVGAVISGEGNGFAVLVRLGEVERSLATSRGKIRLFASLDTVGAFIQGIGISRFEVDMSRHQPGRLRKARPDRAEAMRLSRTRMQQQLLGFESDEK
jgi:hypothetical protein